jgi:putative Holliday junction resolvase
MRIMAVDHGEKRIGIAISDPSGCIARPLTILGHVSLEYDSTEVLKLAVEYLVDLIVIGQSRDEEGTPNLSGRRAMRFADALKRRSEIPVELWDESLSTQDARRTRLDAGVSKKKRAEPVDSIAASVILQSYLEAHHKSGDKP